MDYGKTYRTFQGIVIVLILFITYIKSLFHVDVNGTLLSYAGGTAVNFNAADGLTQDLSSSQRLANVLCYITLGILPLAILSTYG